MKIMLLILFISAAVADNYCKGLYINHNYYNVEIVKEGLNRVQELVFNRNDNTVYFTFEQIATVPTRVLGYFKLSDRSTGLIEGVRNATGLAIDHRINRLYIGGSDGLFYINLNEKNKVPEKLPVYEDIRSMSYRNGAVYFVNKMKQALKFQSGRVNPVFELERLSVDKFIHDEDYNIIFLHNNKLFKVKMDTQLVNAHENVFATDIATDVFFKPYVCTKDGLYVYKTYENVLDKVGDLIDIRKLAFVTNDEPIYVVVDTLVRLTKNPVACFRENYFFSN